MKIWSRRRREIGGENHHHPWATFQKTNTGKSITANNSGLKPSKLENYHIFGFLRMSALVYLIQVILVENIKKNAFLFLKFPSKLGLFSRQLSSAHSENSEIGCLNCFFEFFAFKIQFPHILTTYNVGTTLCNPL